MKKMILTLFSLLICSTAMSNTIEWDYPPVALSGLSQNGSAPTISIDPSGNVFAGWIQNGILIAQVKPANSAWGSPVNVSGNGASSPSMISDNSGNTTAIWIENGIVKVSTLPFGGVWSSPTSLSNGGASSPCIAVNDAGDLVTAWVRSGNVETSTKLFGAAWQSRVVISSTSAAAPAIANGGTGSSRRAVITWNGLSGTTPVIYTTTKSIPGGTWSSQQVISNTARPAGYSTVAVDVNGNAIALWYSYDQLGTNYSGVAVNSAVRASAGSWLSPVIISEGGIRDPSTLTVKVAYDGLGNAIALWNNSYDNATFSIESAVKPLRQDWSAPTQLIAENPYMYRPDLAASTSSDAVAAIMFYAEPNLIIQSLETDFSGYMNNLWSVPANISIGSENGFPKIAEKYTSNALASAAAWVNYNGSNQRVFAVTGTRGLLLPPTSLSVSQSGNNFGVFTEYSNSISWTASASPTTVGYLVYRNGTFLEQIGNVTSYEDINQVQNGAVTYGISAVDASGTASRMATVNFP